jgi:acyl carrier protein
VLDKRLLDTLSQVFNIDPSKVTLETSQENTPSWDSIAHLKLVFEIEDAFGVRLTSEEIPQATSVTRLQEILGRHQAV